jgi:hypothetical protein
MNKYAEIPQEIVERATELAMLELYENATICVEEFDQAQLLLALMDKHIALLYKPQLATLRKKKQAIQTIFANSTVNTALCLPITYRGAKYISL